MSVPPPPSPRPAGGAGGMQANEEEGEEDEQKVWFIHDIIKSNQQTQEVPEGKTRY